MSYTKTAIGLKCYDWSSVDLLKNLSPRTIVGCKKKSRSANNTSGTT